MLVRVDDFNRFPKFRLPKSFADRFGNWSVKPNFLDFSWSAYFTNLFLPIYNLFYRKIQYFQKIWYLYVKIKIKEKQLQRGTDALSCVDIAWLTFDSSAILLTHPLLLGPFTRLNPRGNLRYSSPFDFLEWCSSDSTHLSQGYVKFCLLTRQISPYAQRIIIGNSNSFRFARTAHALTFVIPAGVYKIAYVFILIAMLNAGKSSLM